MARGVFIDLDDVWNLVLACAVCNRDRGASSIGFRTEIFSNLSGGATRPDCKSPSATRGDRRSDGEDARGQTRVLRSVRTRATEYAGGLETTTVISNGKLVPDFMPRRIRHHRSWRCR